MQLPKSIKIGHRYYNVILEKEIDGGRAWGTHSNYESKIQISKELKQPCHKSEIILHECLHGIFHHWELRNLEGMTDPKEEHLVSTLAKGVIQLLHDNPKLKKFIWENT